MIELLIALVVTGILSTVIFQFVLGQARFGARTTAQEEVSQNTRAPLDLLSSEIRSVPPGSVITAEADRIRFRMPRIWGILCSDLPASGAVVVAFHAGAFPVGEVAVSDDRWGIDVPNPAATARVGLPLAATPAAESAAACPLGGSGLDVYSFEVTGTRPAALVARGTPVFVYQEVEYSADVAPTYLGGETVWLYRTEGADARQPLAGPVFDDAATTVREGLQFEYRTTGDVPAAADLSDLSKIAIRVTAESSAYADKGSRLASADSVIVHLRN